MEAVTFNSMSKRRKNSELIRKTAAYLFLVTGSLFMMIPFFWMLSTSMKDSGVVFEMPPKWIPANIIWDNYKIVLTESNIVGGFFNTLKIVMPTTAIGLFFSALAAYAFARMQFPGRNVLFFALIATMMVPGVVLLVPSFILFRFFGWIDSWKPLMIPGMFGTAAAVFFLRQFFKSIPTELDDAAKMDGLVPFGIFTRIIIPLSKPALATQAIFGFLGGYNDFFNPLIYLNSPDKFTLQLVLATFQDNYHAEWTLIMAGSVLALIPTILLFFFAQKYFVEGITMTGMKG